MGIYEFLWRRSEQWKAHGDATISLCQLSCSQKRPRFRFQRISQMSMVLVVDLNRCARSCAKRRVPPLSVRKYGAIVLVNFRRGSCHIYLTRINPSSQSRESRSPSKWTQNSVHCCWTGADPALTIAHTESES